MSIMSSEAVRSGIPSVDDYLANGYGAVVGMSGRFAAALTCGLMRIQSACGVSGDVAEIGAFEGRFFIALAKALHPGEHALGMDVFNWPDEAVEQRFLANCARHGLDPKSFEAWKCNSGNLSGADVVARLNGRRVRLFHVDGEHSRSALAHDLEVATGALAPGGLIVLDDMLHPGYPTLIATVMDHLSRHPEQCVLCLIDRESVVAATKLVICETAWFKRYETALLEAYRDNVWPLGADFEPHWCLVLSLDTRLAEIR
jgi:predicted O-methyltransferase YrrM